jgi:hypothetical protein
MGLEKSRLGLRRHPDIKVWGQPIDLAVEKWDLRKEGDILITRFVENKLPYPKIWYGTEISCQDTKMKKVGLGSASYAALLKMARREAADQEYRKMRSKEIQEALSQSKAGRPPQGARWKTKAKPKREPTLLEKAKWVSSVGWRKE